MLAAVKIRGDVDAREKVSRTLKDLGLEKKNQVTVYEDSDSVRGMLKVVKDYVTYGEVDEETVERLEERTGEEIENGTTINLSPPSGGFKNTKKNSGQGGSLGERSDIDDLVAKMV